ncbi:MAG: hypothetical protein RQ748_12610, partial [Elusimicrobiales bacterium]|nr:hypothetical protein [Elusimicrobiales bacterium]
DAIPMHLLTTEAFRAYFRRLKPDGVLAVHVSNRFLDLEPLVVGLALQAGRRASIIESNEDEESGAAASTWVLVSADQELMSMPLIDRRARAMAEGREPLVFTDRFSNLFRLMRLEWPGGRPER